MSQIQLLLYGTIGVVLLICYGVVLPWLISAKSTELVIIGFVLLGATLYGTIAGGLHLYNKNKNGGKNEKEQ